jgi:anti-sigma regulatory factor (Ser/Thr protein kinase)
VGIPVVGSVGAREAPTGSRDDHEREVTDRHVRAALVDAERTHPRVIRDGVESASPAYEGACVPTGCDQQLAPPPPDATRLRFGLESLAGARLLVGEHARAAGLSGQRAEDLVVAINELATNAVRHADGGGTLHVWNRPDRLVRQVQDTGRISDPRVGRRNPVPHVAGGLGLWTVNQLCDLVEVRSGEAGTTVRVHTITA